jgi:hypothetical protein
MFFVLITLPITIPVVFIYQTGCKIFDTVFDTEYAAHTIFWGRPGLTKKELKQQETKLKEQETKLKEQETKLKEQEYYDYIENAKQFAIDPTDRCSKCYKKSKLYIDKDNIKTCEICS